MDSIDRIKKDKELRNAWQANIAMAFVDKYHAYKKRSKKQSLSSWDICWVADEAADHFLKLLLDEYKIPKRR